jgi:hypothetical protein
MSVSFKIFLSVWNKIQGQSTPIVHFRIADWLENAWNNGNCRLLLMAFRSCGKSTIVGLFAGWLLYSNPNLRIMVLAADMLLARKMVRNVKRIVERHPLTSGLKPEKLDQWGSDRFTIRRPLELRDPSMLARGISANITGSRADIIICDDVEVPRTSETADRRAELRERLGEIDFVLTPGGMQLYVGTPHSWFTIYAEEAREEIGEMQPFLEGFDRLTVPVIENDVSAWPERFSLEEIDSIRRRSGPNRFSSQMMLQPVNIAEGRLDPSLMIRYSHDLHMSDELNGLYIGDRKMVSASAWWDPAFGRGDSSVLAAVFTDEEGVRYLHGITYMQAEPMPEETDEARRQCRLVIAQAKRLHLPFVAIETNGIGKFLPGILRQEIAKSRISCAVLEKTSRRAKDLRILEAFDVVLAARMLRVHDSIYKSPFLNEMQEWRPGVNGRDDGLDAVAGALSIEPIRLKRLHHTAQARNWRNGGQHIADTDFKV